METDRLLPNTSSSNEQSNLASYNVEANTLSRRRALDEIDNAKFSWFHVKGCLVAGIGFFTDAYDIFVIGLAVQMISIVHFGGKIPPNIDLALKVATPAGTFLGQLIFGYLADRVGRKKMYGIELIIIIISTLGQCFSWYDNRLHLVLSIVIWRTLMGIGIGGDYPLSAVITSEFANTKNRGAMMAAVFSMQGFGILIASLVSMTVLSVHKEAILKDPHVLDYVWRTVIGVGIIPACIALYSRLTIPETPRYTMDIDSNLRQATQDIAQALDLEHDEELLSPTASTHFEVVPKASVSDFYTYFSQWDNLKVLIGCSVAWFALDVAFYGIHLNNPIILKSIGFSDNSTPFSAVWSASVGAIVIAMLGTVPGYWVTVFTIDSLGRRTIQIIGFVQLTILFMILGFYYDHILNFSIYLFIGIYTLANFFTNFGPNTTTFIIPGEVFPTRYRSTGHGISAASGKLGAIMAQLAIFHLQQNGTNTNFIPSLLKIFSLFMLIGLLVTFLLPETKGKSLEELSNESYYERTLLN
jgi:PHS family inorganic phosphate transporter-like MFS transporter